MPPRTPDVGAPCRRRRRHDARHGARARLHPNHVPARSTRCIHHRRYGYRYGYASPETSTARGRSVGGIVPDEREAIRGNQRPSEAIRGHQRQSEAIRGHQRQSEAIRGNQRQSEAIRDTHQRHSEAIRGNQRRSEAIRGHQRQSEAIRGDQRRSEAIRGHQRPSEAIRGHQRRSEAIRGNQRHSSEALRGAHQRPSYRAVHAAASRATRIEIMRCPSACPHQRAAARPHHLLPH